MKIFAFLMAVMVLYLSILPCADDANAMAGKMAKTEFSASTNHQHGPKSDLCSHFCLCSCCAGFYLNHFISSIGIIPAYKQKPQPTPLPINITKISLPVWQPPQL